MTNLFISQNKPFFIPFIVPITTTCSFCIENNPISSATISLNDLTNKVQMVLSNNDISIINIKGGTKTQNVNQVTQICTEFMTPISITNLLISNPKAIITGLVTNSNNYISITPVNSVYGRIYNLKASITIIYENNNSEAITTLVEIAPNGAVKTYFNNESHIFNGTLKLVKENNIKASSINISYNFTVK